MLISQVLSQDHRYLDECYDKLKSASTTEDKVKWRNMLVWNLARHAISEELTVYPAMEQHLGERGKELTKTDFARHQAVKNNLSGLQSLSPNETQFPSLLEQVMDDLHRHIEHEREIDMPLLESSISKAESERLAMSFMRTKKLMPTKSHPGAPTSSPLTEGLAALLVAPIDKLRSLVESFPNEETGTAEVDWGNLV
ncbi:HHE domain-containing protein [Cadophora sp. MPI-SDFR-AT-0126]|nr:HHE domain-containing protein [Leotiomycetes sp. MPI-SDFR-AT-0126]